MKEFMFPNDITSKISVLYVDDEEGLLEIAKLFLERSGQFNVDTVTSAPEALHILESASYDAIISDYQMPEMDGIAFLKAIRTKFPDLPFIIFTGKGREDVVIEAFDNGADFYLQKGGQPVPQFLELSHKIDAAVSRRRAEKAFQESEARYRNVVENQTEFISRFLPDGTHIFANEAYCRYFNKKKEEILGKKFKPDIPEAEQGRIKEYFLSLTKEHPIADIEHRIVMPDGDTRWQQWNDRAIFDDNGVITEYQSVGRDITERKRSEEELRMKNAELHAAYEQIAAAEEELRQNYGELDEKEQKLRESEENYRRIVETAYEGIWVLDSHFRIIRVNNRMAEMLGCPPQEIQGRSVTDFIHSSDLPDHESHAAVRRKGVKDRYERRYLRKDGKWIWTLVSATPVFNHNEFVGSFAMITDISERKRVEEALREREQLYRKIVETAPGMLIICDSHGKNLYITSNCKNITGYTQEELIGNIVWWVHEDDTPRMEALLKDTLEKQISGHNVEFKGIKKDGEIWYGSQSWEPIKDSQGNLIEFVMQVIDITSRRKDEKALRESEEKYRTVFENTGTATVVLEEYGVISLVNNEFAQLSGFSKDEIEGKKSWTEFVTDEDLERMLAQHRLRRQDPEKALPHYEFQFVTKSGDIRTIYLTIDVIPGTKKSLASLMDITERKRTEMALRQVNRKLTLLSGITRHDMNNQISMLTGFLNILEKRQSDITFSEYFNKISTTVNLISAMIRFTKAYEEIGVHAPLWQDTHELITATTKEIPLGNITVKNDLPAGLEVFADPMIMKVFHNLVDNAVRHGGKIFTIRFSGQESGDNFVLVCEDDGEGISAAKKEQIFVQDFSNNAGQGLFLAREILSITGIAIQENGEPGKGARFEMTVPKEVYRIADAVD